MSRGNISLRGKSKGEWSAPESGRPESRALPWMEPAGVHSCAWCTCACVCDLHACATRRAREHREGSGDLLWMPVSSGGGATWNRLDPGVTWDNELKGNEVRTRPLDFVRRWLSKRGRFQSLSRHNCPLSCPAITFLVWTVFAFGFSCLFFPRLLGPPLPSFVPCASLPCPKCACYLSFCSLHLRTPGPWEAASSSDEAELPRCSGKIPRSHPSPLFLSQLTHP